MSPVRPLNRYSVVVKIYGLLDIYVVGKKIRFGGLTG